MHKITVFPLGNGDTLRIDMNNGQKLLFDFANMQNPDDSSDLRIDLPTALRDDLRGAGRNYYDVVAFTHFDDDHIRGATEFFHLEHNSKFHGKGRVEIGELWVPAAAIVEEDIDNEEARILQAEAQYRLLRNERVKVFSRPEKLEAWLKKRGSELTGRNLVIEAGRLVPGFDKYAQGVEFFVHSPFAEACDGDTVDRNEGSLVFQAVFRWGGIDTRVMLSADTPWDNLAAMVRVTEAHSSRHGGVDRLGWEVFKLPHHCSYLSLSSEKGKDKTEPVPEVKRLFELHGARGGIIVATSDPIPTNDTTQPPHRQAAQYYRDLMAAKGGDFIVTMEHPTKTRPEPLVIIIDTAGATPDKRISRGTASVTTHTAPRAGRGPVR
ncbi:MAG: hypothetical protein M3441_04250 [Chloroflexota bacterium]|nr:hypothetical protein [Chloroflexota bacterium]